MKKLLLTLLIASPTLLFAQGSMVSTQGMKALGMAGAGTSLFIDETSVYYNPGAVAKMDRNAAYVGVGATMYRAAFKEVNSTEVHHTKFKISTPFSAFATFGPKNTWWKAGIGVYTPFGGGVDWGRDWPGKYELHHLNMKAIYIQPTFSFKLTENFSLGGGFVYALGDVDLSRSIPVFDENGNPGHAQLTGKGNGTGFNLGAHYHLDNDFAVSLSYRSKVKVSVDDGDAAFEVPSAVASSFPNTQFSAALPLPAAFNIGISFPLSEKVDMALDGTFIGYDVYKSLTFDYHHNTDDIIGDDALEDTHQLKKYDNSFSGKVGINYKPSDKLALRTGAGYVFTPVQGKYLSPETPDNSRIMASAGFTYDISDKLDITGAYVFQRLLQRTVTNAATGMAGTYKTNIHVPGISLTYKW